VGHKMPLHEHPSPPRTAHLPGIPGTGIPMAHGLTVPP